MPRRKTGARPGARRSGAGPSRAGVAGDVLIIQRDLALDLARISDIATATRRILDAALAVGRADAGGVYLREADTGDLVLECHHGLSAAFVTSVAREPAGSRRIQFVSAGRPIYDPPLDDAVRGEGLRAVCSLPVLHEQNLLATINLAYRTRRLPREDLRRGLESIAAQLGGVLGRLQARRDLIESERRFRLLFKSLPLPAYLWRRVDNDFSFCDHNDAAVAVTQGHVIKILGVRASDYYRQRPDIVADMNRCYASQGALRSEIPYRFAHSGDERELEVSYSFAPPDTVMVYVEDITDQRRAAADLDKAYAQLEAERAELQAKNLALREILDHLENSKKQVARQLTANIERLVMPLLGRLTDAAGSRGLAYAEHLRGALADVTAPFVNTLETRFAALTPREVQICSLIRGGLTSKDVARTLGITEETVRTQRKTIRRKLGIAGGASNLETFLRLVDRGDGWEGDRDGSRDGRASAPAGVSTRRGRGSPA